jgi:hypothetical protein
MCNAEEMDECLVAYLKKEHGETLYPRYSELCGFAKDDILQNFQIHLRSTAKALRKYELFGQELAVAGILEVSCNGAMLQLGRP